MKLRIPERELVSVQAAILALLAEEPKSFSKLREKLKEIGWNAETRQAMYGHMTRLEDDGLIISEPFDDGNRLLRLTKKGCITAIDYRDFHAALFERIDEVSPDDFPDIRSKPRNPPKKQRHPTAEEVAMLLDESDQEFGRLLEFSHVYGRKVSDLIGARIEDYCEERQELTLPEQTENGRAIDERLVKVASYRGREIIQQAVADRQEGEIFLTKQGQPWTINKFGATFRRLRRKCGLPSNVVSSGRGSGLQSKE